MTNVMLIGGNQWVIDSAEKELSAPDWTVFGATSPD